MRDAELDIWIFGALHGELDLLLGQLGASYGGRMASQKWYRAQVRGLRVGLGTTGVGLASAALSLGAFMGISRASKAVMVGTCGAFPGTGLRIGDLVVVSSEALSELGVVAGAGIGDAREMDPLGLRQEISLSEELVAPLLQAGGQVGKTHSGKILTVVGSSNSISRAKARRGRFDALAENMEGYALALAGSKLGFQVGEIRCVSNLAGRRDRSFWALEQAQQKAQMALISYLERL